MRDPAWEPVRDPAGEGGAAWWGDCVVNGGDIVSDCDLWGCLHGRGQK